jgi:hypothetical protein
VADGGESVGGWAGCGRAAQPINNMPSKMSKKNLFTAAKYMQLVISARYED